MNLTAFILFWIIFMVLLAGVGTLLQAGTRAEIAKRRALSGWPKTSGVVTGARVEEKGAAFFLPGRRLPSTMRSYLPVIEYTYQIGGKVFQSAHYKNAWSPFNRSGNWRTVYPKKAARIVEEHAPGKTVEVTFNPDNPAEAYLAVDGATTGSWTWRLSGLALILAAGLLLARGTAVIISDRTSQAQIDRIPAVVPVASLDLQSGLQRNLGLACKSDQPNFAGETITYLVWMCENPADATAPTVWFYSRLRAPEKVDYVNAIPGGTKDMAQMGASLASIARLTAQGANTQAVEDWVVATTPQMQKQGDQAKINLGWVSYSLSVNVTDYFKSVKLEIGELQ